MSSNDKIPVFIITGFLDSGKTTFLSYTIGLEYFHIEGNTLLLICERGEQRYDSDLLEREHTIPVNIAKQDDLTRDHLSMLAAENKAERVLIEYNGMWNDPGTIDMPENWEVVQQLTLINGSTLGLYLANMRPLMGPMLRNTELCIVNRCDGIDRARLQEYKMVLRPMLLSGSAVLMQDRRGEIMLPVMDEDLPFDVSGDNVVLDKDTYGVWFFDAKDYPERYAGKTVEYSAQIRKQDSFGEGVFAFGRVTMICCENDMTFLAYLGSFRDGSDASEYPESSWVRIRTSVETRERKEYRGTGPFLIIESIEPAQAERPY